MAYGLADAATAQITGSITRQRTLDVLLQQTAPVPGGVWPNEPASYTVISDWGFDQPLAPNMTDQPIPGSPGWHQVFNGGSPPASGAILFSDAGAPQSPVNVYQFRYAAGFVAGSAPCTLYHSYTGPELRTYTGIWWKPSNPFTPGPGNTTKIYFLIRSLPNAYSQILEMTDLTIGGVLGLRTRIVHGPGSVGLAENVGSSWAPLAQFLGIWHQLEMLSDPPAATLKWWVDGVLVGSYSGLNYGGSVGYSNFKISPTWGGVGGTVPQDQYFWYDHIHISGS